MKRFQEHFYYTIILHQCKADITEVLQDKIDPIRSHFSLPEHDESDLQISILAFITLSPMSKEALVLRLNVEKKWIQLMRCPEPLD